MWQVRRDRQSLGSAIVIAAALSVVLTLGGCSGDADGGGEVSDAPLAPPFTLATIDGGTTALADHSGKLIFLNFWATWCPPCREEMPLFNDLRAKYVADDFEVLAVTLDDLPHEVVPSFVEEFGLDFPILIGTPELLEDYPFFGLPTTFVISREGRIVEVLDGAQPLDAFDPLIQKHL